MANVIHKVHTISAVNSERIAIECRVGFLLFRPYKCSRNWDEVTCKKCLKKRYPAKPRSKKPAASPWRYDIENAPESVNILINIHYHNWRSLNFACIVGDISWRSILKEHKDAKLSWALISLPERKEND